MESNVQIPTPDGKTIYGRLRGEINNPTVVFVHGLGGVMDQHIYFNGARFLEKSGISSFRFGLYGWDENARSLSECTLGTHCSDLELVIDYLRDKGGKTIFAVGHSFGGPTILLSQERTYSGIILWDPSYDYPLSFKEAQYVKSLDAYIIRWNMDIVINKGMIKEASTLKEREEKAIKELRVPIKIINADDSHLVSGGKRYFELASDPKAHVILSNSGHTFDADGAEEKLFQETLSWVTKFS